MIFFVNWMNYLMLWIRWVWTTKIFTLYLNCGLIYRYVSIFSVYLFLCLLEQCNFKCLCYLMKAISKWTSFGACLVPQEMVEERTVDYAFRWLLASFENHGNFSRMAFLLDWLTGKHIEHWVPLVQANDT